MLPALVILTLAIFAGALFWSPHAGHAAWLHLMLAAGAMPLIFGAMSHFIPVLTRTREARRNIGILPAVALAGGALVVVSFSLANFTGSREAGAVLAASSVFALFVWSRRRRTSMLGSPHSCLGWYEAALACLFVALLAILAGSLWPQHFLALRRFHLHLNTLGFIGLTAVSTLAVLMPTVVGRPDREAAQRLRRDLPFAFGGTLLIAIGSAWLAPLAWLGMLAWSIPLARMGTAWLRLYGAEIFAWHGAAPLLAISTLGFSLCLLAGAATTLGTTFDPSALFIAGFLLPLVSGAASQLLPVWLKPGMQNAWHGNLRARLGRYNGVRALLFLIGGLAAGLKQEWGLLLGAAALIWFLLQAAASLILFRQGHPS